MKSIIIVAALLAASSLSAAAQTAAPAPSKDASTPAVAAPETANPAAPVAGKNSFTEAQAKDRLEKNGFSEVTGLKLDDNGIWQATAKKDAASRTVSLDYQGNIVAK